MINIDVRPLSVPARLILFLLSVISLNSNYATATILEQMPVAKKFSEQSWVKSSMIRMIDTETFGKCSMVFIYFLNKESNGTKFNDTESLGIALLGEGTGIARKNFLANGYPDSYLTEILLFHEDLFRMEHIDQCAEMINHIANSALAPKETSTKSDDFLVNRDEKDKSVNKFTQQGGPGRVGSSTALRWSYDGELNPEKWGEAFPICSRGKSQAPIDITGPFITASTAMKTEYRPGLLTIMNNGNTIQVNVPSGSKLRIDGVPYDLLQFHFHRPSEEKIDGMATAMILHFVHKSNDGKLAILAVFLKQGVENLVIKNLWTNLPREIGSPITYQNVSFNPANLLPSNFDFYTYEASLSTPPCTEGVRYIVLKTPVSISSNQVQAFPFKSNVRPIQPLNGRTIFSNN